MSDRTNRTQVIKDYILRQVSDHPTDISSITARKFGISRQSVSRHLRNLVVEGVLTATGHTRAREYRLTPLVNQVFRLDVSPDLQEDLVWSENIFPLLKDVPGNVLGICHYGFTEMLNNVIDHSGATSALVSLHRNAASIGFIVQDNGVGIYNKIQSELHLDDPRHALLELSKGKLTTNPEAHTGEGIFFTSKMFNTFTILSDALAFSQSYDEDGWLIDFEYPKPTSGTVVSMEIRPNARHTMQEIFDKFAAGDDDFSFSRTIVALKLARHEGEELVSRSQAKRLLARVDQFREVILDFQDVLTIGPSFADEIFRVFAKQHPEIELNCINTGPQIERMIMRARSKTPRAD